MYEPAPIDTAQLSAHKSIHNKKANLTKVRDAKPRVLASSATLCHEEPKIAGPPILGEYRDVGEEAMKRITMVLVAIVLTACGGGGGSSGNPQPPPPPTPPPPADTNLNWDESNWDEVNWQ